MVCGLRVPLECAIWDGCLLGPIWTLDKWRNVTINVTRWWIQTVILLLLTSRLVAVSYSLPIVFFSNPTSENVCLNISWWLGSDMNIGLHHMRSVWGDIFKNVNDVSILWTISLPSLHYHAQQVVAILSSKMKYYLTINHNISFSSVHLLSFHID
jgi:hypothetical protein